MSQQPDAQQEPVLAALARAVHATYMEIFPSPSVEQRLDGSELAVDVCGGRHQTVFISGHFSVTVNA